MRDGLQFFLGLARVGISGFVLVQRFNGRMSGGGKLASGFKRDFLLRKFGLLFEVGNAGFKLGNLAFRGGQFVFKRGVLRVEIVAFRVETGFQFGEFAFKLISASGLALSGFKFGFKTGDAFFQFFR
jgi:hypothetical protein